jgi:hypothetical protein
MAGVKDHRTALYMPSSLMKFTTVSGTVNFTFSDL